MEVTIGGYPICWPKDKRNGERRVPENCPECVSVTEPNDSATEWPGTRLGFTSVPSSASGPITRGWTKMNPGLLVLRPGFRSRKQLISFKKNFFNSCGQMTVDILPEKTTLAIFVLLLFLNFILYTYTFHNCIDPMGFSNRKFRLPSPGKASCDRVALLNLGCMLGVLRFP